MRHCLPPGRKAVPGYLELCRATLGYHRAILGPLRAILSYPGPSRRESGAGSETRTRTLSPVLDFESSASTSSAIPAVVRIATHEARPCRVNTIIRPTGTTPTGIRARIGAVRTAGVTVGRDRRKPCAHIAGCPVGCGRAAVRPRRRRRRRFGARRSSSIERRSSSSTSWMRVHQRACSATSSPDSARSSRKS